MYSRRVALDASLLNEAKLAQERLVDAELQADLARADFHRAVRRLQLNGASLREVATELGLSHQRVQQIVQAAGGARRWATPREPNRGPDSVCSFCGGSRPGIKKLIAGPGVYICESCVGTAMWVISSGIPATTGLGPVECLPAEANRAQCSFCGKRRHQVAGLASCIGGPGRDKAGGPATVCDECVRLCREIIAEELT
jgi:hypothetical protein